MDDTVIRRKDIIENFNSGVCDASSTTNVVSSQEGINHLMKNTEWQDWNQKILDPDQNDKLGAGGPTDCTDIRNGIVSYTVLADKALRDLERYRDQADSLNKAQLMSKYQNQISQFNQKKINNYNSDIMTTRRQVEISINEFKRRENNIFILKTFFVYLLLCMIPLLLSSTGTKILPRNISLIILVILTLFFAVIFLRNLMNSISRSLINYDIINYDTSVEAGHSPKPHENHLQRATIQLLLAHNESLAKQAATCGQTWQEVEQEAQRDEKIFQEVYDSFFDTVEEENSQDADELSAISSQIRKYADSKKVKKYPVAVSKFNDLADQVDEIVSYLGG